jgi:hypothetical protein
MTVGGKEATGLSFLNDTAVVFEEGHFQVTVMILFGRGAQCKVFKVGQLKVILPLLVILSSPRHEPGYLVGRR